LRNETGLLVFLLRAREGAFLRSAIFVSAASREQLHITSIQARYPQLGGDRGHFAISRSSPSNGGVTPLFPAAMLFAHWRTIKNFGAVTYGVQAICRAGI
jgi:hypothetical protein